MRTSIVSFGLGSATGSALSCFCLAWFSSLLMCFLVSFSDGFQVLIFLAVGHWAPSEKGNGLLIPHTFVWGSYFLFCIPSAVRPPSVRRPLVVLLSHVQHCYTHNAVTHTHMQLFHAQRFHTHTHTFVTHNSFTHTHTHKHARAFVTQLCPTQLCHTHTHGSFTRTNRSHTLSHTILSHTHTQLFYTHNSSHTHTHTQLFHTELCHTHSRRGTWASTSPPCRRRGTW